MITRTLEKEDWKPYFDFVSKLLLGKGVDIEVLSYGLGAQKMGMMKRMWGVTYDPKDNILEVATETLDHIINNPTLIRVVEEGVLLRVIEITQGDGIRQLIHIKEQLALPQELY